MIKVRSISKSLMVAGMAWVAAWMPVAQSAAATPAATVNYRVLYRFKQSAGYHPQTPLLQAPDGYFYGTTTAGGKHNYGTIFRLDPIQRRLEVLHSFNDPYNDPHNVNASTGLTLGPDGAMYGLTAGGGKYKGGTAYRITTTGQFKLLHSFGSSPMDGIYPTGGALALAPDGYFYGTTYNGGIWKFGTAFRMSPSGKVVILHHFQTSDGEGRNPVGQLMLASDGNFYGTTNQGAYGNCGALYRMTPDGVTSVVSDFTRAESPPCRAESAPTQGADGFLYGTTWWGGAHNGGAIYKVSLDGTSFAVLHDFPYGMTNNPTGDGSHPMGKLILGSDNNLYGVCFWGGDTRYYGLGTVYKISTTGIYETIVQFGQRNRDAIGPNSELVQGTDGGLYGTTLNGGNNFGALYRVALP